MSKPDIEVHKDIAYIVYYTDNPSEKLIGIELDVLGCTELRRNTIYEGAAIGSSVS